MDHDGRRYPKSDYEGVSVPEAYEHNTGILPHEHCDLEARFPKAVAAEPQADQDVDAEDLVEQRGVTIGMRGDK